MADAERLGKVTRKTRETEIELLLRLDGKGRWEGDTAVYFLNHMLELLAYHGLFDLKIKASGDLKVDAHHLVEDTGICLGKALRQAVGDKKGIERYGFYLLPMDESLAMIALDFSGRPHLCWEADFACERIGDLPAELIKEFLQSLVLEAGITLHVKVLAGENGHHMAEAIFKGLGRALRMALEKRGSIDGIPSTKGVL